MHPDIVRKVLRFYWRHAWHYPRKVVGLFLTVPVTVLAGQILPPLIAANVLSRLARGDFQPHHIWASFGTQILGYAALQMGSGVICWRIVDYFAWTLEGNVQEAMAREVFGHMLDESASFHANHFSGSLVSQSSKLLSSYVRFADTTIFQVLPLLSSLTLISIFLARRAPLFVAVFISFAVLYMFSAFFVSRPTRRRAAAQAAAESEQTGHLADAITNVMAIKSFAGEAFENRTFGRAAALTHKRTLSVMHASARQQTYFNLMINSISPLSLALAVVAVMAFKANIATVFLILSYTSSTINQLFNFSNNSLRNYNRSFGDAADMVEILGMTPEIQDPAKPEKPRISKGEITFDKVTFTHDGADGALFTGLSLAIRPGEKIGLVGHSGSGKTTLTRILLRFSDVDGGEIRIDGQNIALLTQADLRRHIAYVPQEPLLFHRSVRENIAYGKPDASLKAIKEAAREANAASFIEQLPDGYETLVGERGVKLSGGQRQRIAIARAILKDAPILVLDEATSALDSESEKLIQTALWQLMEGRTAIVIAHRLSTIQKMDRIIVLDNGQIVEQGSHGELLKQKGAYARLWKHQSGGFIEE